MSTHIVKHGATYSLAGTLAAGATLTALSGAPGGLIEVYGYARNKGAIDLIGAPAPHKHGGTLIDAGTLKNAGVITVGGASDSTHAALLQIDGVLINNATLIAAAGTYGAGGTVLIDGHGRLKNAGTLTLAGGGAQGSQGAALLADGVLTNAVSGTLELRGAAGTVAGAGFGASLAVAGTLTNSGLIGLYGSPGGVQKSDSAIAPTLSIFGVATNAGTIDVGKPITDYVDRAYNTSNGALFAVEAVLTNTSSLSVAAESIYSYGATLTVAGTLINQGQVFLQAGGFTGFVGYAAATDGALLEVLGTFDNDGLLTVAGYAGTGGSEGSALGGTAVIEGTLLNAGTIALQQDSNLIANGTLTNNGTIVSYGGHTFGIYQVRYYGSGAFITLNGTLNNNGLLALHGGLDGLATLYPPYYDSAGSNLFIKGSLSNSGTLLIGGGSGAYPGSDGAYGLGATATIGGTFGSIENSGLITIQQGAKSAYGASGTGGVLVDAGGLSNSSTIDIAGGINAASGTLYVTSTGFLENYRQIYGSGVLLNKGVIAGDNGAFGPGLTFVNDGTISTNLFGFSLVVGSNITTDPGQTGTIDIVYKSTIALNGGVGPGQLIDFSKAPDNLQLGDLPGFSGTLSGLAATDVIDFLGQTVVTASASGTTLAIGLVGGTTYDLALAAPLNGLSLQLHGDGQGGTDLVFSTQG